VIPTAKFGGGFRTFRAEISPSKIFKVEILVFSHLTLFFQGRGGLAKTKGSHNKAKNSLEKTRFLVWFFWRGGLPHVRGNWGRGVSKGGGGNFWPEGGAAVRAFPHVLRGRGAFWGVEGGGGGGPMKPRFSGDIR